MPSGHFITHRPYRTRRNMLICKFASARSHPDRIDSWIAYLEEKKRVCAADADAATLLDRLLSQARDWRIGAAVPRA